MFPVVPSIRLGCQYGHSENTNGHPSQRFHTFALGCSGKCERGKVFAVLSEKQVRLSDVRFGPGDDSSGVLGRFRAAIQQDRVTVSEGIPVYEGYTATLRVVDDLNGNALSNQKKAAHDSVVPDAELR
jgi:hypothetical protein